MYELLINPKKALRDTKLLIAFSFFVTLLSFFIYETLKDNISIFASRVSLYFIITLILTQFTTKLFEEIEYEEETGKINYLTVVVSYLAISLGMLFGFLLFPGNFKIIDGGKVNPLYILQNNITLAFTFFLIAFLFGTGAEFLLAYNADLLAYALRFKPSIFFLAIIEFVALFHFAIAGAILSIGIVRNRVSKRIIFDMIKMIAIGIALLILAYFIEISLYIQ